MMCEGAPRAYVMKHMKDGVEFRCLKVVAESSGSAVILWSLALMVCSSFALARLFHP